MNPVQLTKDELRELRTIRPWRSLGSIAWTWTWIVAAFAFYVASPGILASVVGFIIVSSRLHALAVLMHEGAHRLTLQNRAWNDRISQWLCAYPLMLDTVLYRRQHLPHHRHTWTDRDPDLELARPFPISKKSMIRKIIRDLSGQTGIKSYYGLARFYAGLAPTGRGLEGRSLLVVFKTLVVSRFGCVVVSAVIFAALTLAGHWEAFLLLWVAPMISGFWLLLRMRSISEHAAVSDPTDLLHQTRTTLASPLMRFLIAPHDVNLHLEHHLFQFVPHYNLKRLHHILAAQGVVQIAEVAKSYVDVWRAATASAIDTRKDAPTLFVK